MFNFDEKLTTRVFRLYSQKMHQKRLSEIKTKNSSRINNSVPRTLRYQNIKKNGHVVQEKKRQSDINRENKKIFQMITDISSGKKNTTIQNIIDSVKASPQLKSLNLPARKKEAQRIIDDNEALARRLYQTNREVSFEKFDEDWKTTTKYLNTISRKKFRELPKIDELNKHLNSRNCSESRRIVASKSPVTAVHKRYQSAFSPKLRTPLPSVRLEEKAKISFPVSEEEEIRNLKGTGEGRKYKASRKVESMNGENKRNSEESKDRKFNEDRKDFKEVGGEIRDTQHEFFKVNRRADESAGNGVSENKKAREDRKKNDGVLDSRYYEKKNGEIEENADEGLVVDLAKADNLSLNVNKNSADKKTKNNRENIVSNKPVEEEKLVESTTEDKKYHHAEEENKSCNEYKEKEKISPNIASREESRKELCEKSEAMIEGEKDPDELFDKKSQNSPLTPKPPSSPSIPSKSPKNPDADLTPEEKSLDPVSKSIHSSQDLNIDLDPIDNSNLPPENQ